MYFLKPVLKSEIGGGLVLMASAVIALLWANSPAAPLYFDTLKTYVFGLSILHWINDALMAVFFLLVGLEIKRELVEGELSTPASRVLPGFAAIGGMVVPALVFIAINTGSVEGLRGWAIPVATDIAFSLGVLALLGSRVPASLKVFLTALAIIDDLGAIVIIALFYSTGLSPVVIGLAVLMVVVLSALNLARVKVLWPYLLFGLILWYLVLKSGVHATIAGVVLAMTIPIERDGSKSPLRVLEHALQPWVTFLVLPVFALANAGVALGGVSGEALLHPVTLGIALGLFVGKQIGVFGGVWVAVRLGIAALPDGAGWRHIYGVAILCGIGFTVSLFIGLLAFDTPELNQATKVGVLAGSLLSAVGGWLVLRGARKS
ncbi:MAG: Na+/H+ antiporter NhaA [Bauldia sp.]